MNFDKKKQANDMIVVFLTLVFVFNIQNFITSTTFVMQATKFVLSMAFGLFVSMNLSNFTNFKIVRKKNIKERVKND